MGLTEEDIVIIKNFTNQIGGLKESLNAFQSRYAHVFINTINELHTSINKLTISGLNRSIDNLSNEITKLESKLK